MNRQALLGTEDTRYSLKTLQALYYGAMYGGVSDRGILHITFSDTHGDIYTGTVISTGPAGVLAYAIDCIPETRFVTPERIIHAEVI